jgi:hypothetical protein
MIFTIGRATTLLEPCWSHDCRNTFVINMSHVCHAWRTVALASCSLWTLICCHAKEEDPRSRMAEFMRRAKPKPLDLHLNFWSPHQVPLDEELAGMDRILDVAAPAADRWISLTVIWGSDNARMHMAERLRSLRVNQLETMCVRLALPGEGAERHLLNQELNELMLFEGGALSLRTLRLYNIHWPLCEVGFTPALTTLSMSFFQSNLATRFKYKDLANLLVSAPALSELIIQGVMLPMEISDNMTPLLAPALRKLSVDTHMIGICTVLSTPALEELELPYCHSFQFGMFCNFLSRSEGSAYPALRILRISLNPELEQARVLVQHTSSIKRVDILLDLSESLVTGPQPVRLLEAAAQIQGSWPMLETVELFGVDRKSLRNFITSRISSRTPFKTIVMHPTFLHAIRDNHSAEFEWISEQGIELRKMTGKTPQTRHVIAYMRFWKEGS